MPIATINGAHLEYEVSGDGPAIVFLHEGIADRTMWSREIQELSPDHRILNFDQRGFGASDLPSGSAAWHEDVVRLMEHVGMRAATIVGASFGASVALNVALFRPPVVRGLVLVGPGVGGRTSPPDVSASVEAIDALAEQGDFNTAAEETLRLWLDGPSRPRGTVGGALRQRLHRINVEILKREQTEWKAVEPLRLQPPAASRLEDIHVPTLVIVGADDLPFIQDNARFLAAGIADAQLIVIENAAHAPNLEHPDRFGDILRLFLRRHGL